MRPEPWSSRSTTSPRRPDAIEVLTELLGAPPSDEPYRATNHTPAGVYHAWDDLVIDERFYDEAVRDEWPLRFAVYFDGPSVRGLDLASAQGFHADDAWTTLSGDPVVDSGLLSCEGTPVEAFDAVDESPRTVAVVARASDDGATIRWLSAPQSVMERLGCV